MSEVKDVVIIGYGLAGSVFHAPIIAATPGLRLAGIVTKSDERVAQARQAYGEIEVFATTEELWRNMTPDLVVVATPNITHAPIALEAIRHGVAVVVDKPLAISSAEAADVVAEARAKGVLLTVFQNRRWDGDFLTVKELVESNSLGTVCRFESRFERWRPTLKGGWRESSGQAQGGGLLFDLGSHLIDQAVNVFGEVSDVYAEVDTRRAGATSDDDVFVALTHRTGVRSHLYASAVAADLGPRFRVLGTGGAYVTYGLDPQEAALREGRSPGPGWGEVDETDWGTVSGSETKHIPTAAGAYPEFYRQLAAALISGSPPPVNPDDAVNTLRIIEAASRSSRNNEVVEL